MDTVFWLQKDGNEPEEYEDAFSVELEHGCFALADGASDSAFSQLWARIVTERFVESQPNKSESIYSFISSWLSGCQDSWHKGIPWDRLPWHGEEKAKRGASATFLGLRFDRPGPEIDSPCRWWAVAIGDTCLFQIRRGRIVTAFPIDNPDSFSNTPELLCSNPLNNPLLQENIRVLEGEFVAGDRLFLATDALAHWALSQSEARKRPWLKLSRQHDESAFHSWIGSMRRARTIRNDDTTLICIVR